MKKPTHKVSYFGIKMILNKNVWGLYCHFISVSSVFNLFNRLQKISKSPKVRVTNSACYQVLVKLLLVNSPMFRINIQLLFLVIFSLVVLVPRYHIIDMLRPRNVLKRVNRKKDELKLRCLF